jgi:lipopolysaccharide export system permease protein
VRLIRILDRYVFMEAFGLFMLGFSGFLGFLVVNKLFLEAENILNPQMPGLAIVKVVLLDTPYFINLALPVAVMFATLMSMGRLAKDLELTAMFTNGVSLYRLFLPFLLLSGIAVISSYVTNEYLATIAATKKEQILAANPIIREQRSGEPDPFIVKLENGDFISAKDFDKQQGRLSSIVFDNWQTENGNQMVVSSSAQTDGNDLIMGQSAGAPAYIYNRVGDGDLYEGYDRESTDKISLGLDLKTQLTQMKTPEELTTTELAEQAKAKKALGENPAQDATDYNLRFSGPFASLAFALLAMPLSLRAPRDERLLGLILCFVLAMVYYTIYFISKMMGYNEVLPPWLAAWMKDIVFGIIAMFIFIFSRK